LLKSFKVFRKFWVLWKNH